MMSKLSVVVPVYYNAESLPHLFWELQKIEIELHERGFELELIFVDDGSGDESLAQLLKIKRARPATSVLKLTRNFGAVHASKAGISRVTGDCFLVLAADLQDPPELILTAVERWKSGSKFVLFARRNRQDAVLSRLFASIYYKLVRLMVVPHYPEGGYDLALMDKAFLPHILNSSKNVNTPLFAYWLGFAPTIITYDRRERRHGRSRWTFSKRLKFLIDSLVGFSVTPIRLILLIGLAVSALSMAYGAVIVVNALRGRFEIQGFPTLATLISFLLGLIIVMLGIIGEYIWRIFDEVNKRPESVIDEVF
jgi:glycosyltransferase involved in cell wall biosynthesis